MTYQENYKTIGKKGTIKLGGLVVDVKIIDYKFTYGRDRWKVAPISGKGEIWVEKVDY